MGVPREGCQRIVCPVQLSGLNMGEGRLLKQTENKRRGIPHSRPGTIGRRKQGWVLREVLCLKGGTEPTSYT